jgi:aconitate hydratase
MAKGTLTQKIIDAHYTGGSRHPGEKVSIRIDQTLTQDATGTMAYLEFEALRVPRVRTELSVSYVDHNMMQNGPENRNDHLYLQSIARRSGVVFSPPGNGICHQLHLERFGVPGRTLLGSDSHTPTGGGLGMLAIGAGGLDVALAMAGRSFTLAYPKVVGVRLSGDLKGWCAAKDVALKLLSILSTKGNVGCVAEYFGPGVATLSVPERATIANMGAELGVTATLFPSDERTREFLRRQDREGAFVPLAADPDARYDRIIDIDLDALVPLAACPSSPDLVKPVGELGGIPVDQVLIGSCTNGSFRDLATAALTLRGRRIAPGVSLGIAPGSRQTLEMLGAAGYLNDFVAAGARILETGCGPCIGQGFSPADGTVSVRTFNRNFAGRSGTRGDRLYLVSPETAAATALTGFLTDPNTLGFQHPAVAEPERYVIDDAHLRRDFDPAAEVVRKPTIGEPPHNTPLPDDLTATVLIKVGDKITTDHIMPAGIHLKHRSNIPVYAQAVFECFTAPGGASFATRAAALRDAGGFGAIVGGESYGQGSSREHAAICPMYLGVRVVAVKSLERIHRANLVNFGILPLEFVDPADYGEVTEGAELKFTGLRTQLASGSGRVTASLGDRKIAFKCVLDPEELRCVLAGGRLNTIME